MKEVMISDNELNELARGEYQRYIVLNGHCPSVLSGSELVGKAREYGSRYASSRENVCKRVKDKYHIESKLILCELNNVKRYRRVWVDESNNCIRFILHK